MKIIFKNRHCVSVVSSCLPYIRNPRKLSIQRYRWKILLNRFIAYHTVPYCWCLQFFCASFCGLRGQLTSPCNYSRREDQIRPTTAYIYARWPGGRVAWAQKARRKEGKDICYILLQFGNWFLWFELAVWMCIQYTHTHSPQHYGQYPGRESCCSDPFSFSLCVWVCFFFQFESVYFMACYACYFVILFRLCSNFFCCCCC